MDLVTLNLLAVVAAVASFVFSCLVLSLIIRYAIFHGMRAHTRWIDEGKDVQVAGRRWG